MSPERPLSQDSGGGGIIEPSNMVLSSIPLESGHIVIQQQQQQHQTINSNGTQINRGSPQIITTTTHHQATSLASATSPTSKYVVFHNNGHYTAETNGGGNILLVATEPMEVSSTDQNIIVNTNGADEELTSLTWLHDKNLLKGIVACTNGKSAGASPARQSNGGTISPTSDFLEDSSVSEDNASSANSSSDQGISIHSSEHSPSTNNGFSLHHQHQLHQQPSPHHFHHSHSSQHHIQYNNNNNININNNNNNAMSKNRNHLMSPNTTPSNNNNNINNNINNNMVQEQHINTNNRMNLNPLGATTTVHSGPSGTTTVVEYKAGTNFIPSSRHFSQVPSSPQRSSPIGNTLVVSSTTSQNSSSTSSSTTHHQHFHKKYLREQMNGIDQNFVGVNGISSLSSDIMNSPNNTLTSLSTNSPGSNMGDPEDLHRTPIKSESVIFNYNIHEDSSKDMSQFEYSNGMSNAKSPNGQKSVPSPKQKHPTNLPYDPMVHTTNKPPYSFSSLIFMAIEDSPEKALPVKEIYAWIVQHFPYFKTAPTGWKNSVRHNLSLNKSFLKVEKAPNMGKGSLWRVEQNQRPNLIQALTRSPFFPCSAVDKMSPYKNSPSTPTRLTDSPPTTPIKSTLDAKLFPKLSKMIKEMVNKGNNFSSEAIIDQYECHQQFSNNNTANGNYYPCDMPNSNTVPQYGNIERLARECGADSIDDVNAATAMLALKHGPKVFSETFQNGSPVITSSPSEDHTYSAGGGNSGGGVGGGGTSGGGGGGGGTSDPSSQNGSDNNSIGASSDVAYESSEESENRHITAEELEEQRRHAEGVDALLSFASKVSSLSSSTSSSPAKRPASTSIDDEHISSYVENIPNLGGTNSNATIIMTDHDGIITNGGTIIHNHQQHFDTQSYYHHLTSPSPPKKLKSPRSLRTKLKRKATWIR